MEDSQARENLRSLMRANGWARKTPADSIAEGEKESLEEERIPLNLLLLSDDEELANFVHGIVKSPWKLLRPDADKFLSQKTFAEPNVRLVILDDQAVEENERRWLLGQIRKHFPGDLMIYIAGIHSDDNERRARTNGAHYYDAKPLAHELFGQVLQSFMQTQQIKG